ncbi:MAG: hypothetical protein R3245_11570, partial [Kiloniellales bacterium]|nr:hypothetical protein [Kiloniellales bacterium]
LWLAATATLGEAGLFRLALQLTAMVMALEHILQTAFTPNAAKLLSDIENKPRFLKFYEDITVFQLKSVIPLVTLGVFFAPDIYSLAFGQDFREGALLFQILALTIIVRIFFGPINNTLIAAGLAWQKLIMDIGAASVIITFLVLFWTRSDGEFAAGIIVLTNIVWAMTGTYLLVRAGFTIVTPKSITSRLGLGAVLVIATLTLAWIVDNLVGGNWPALVISGVMLAFWGLYLMTYDPVRQH